MKVSTVTILASAIVFPGLAGGATIFFDTSTSANWSVTGGGAVNATPYVVSDFGNAGGHKVISLTSNGIDTGTFVSGGSLANFNGFWTATYSFYLPPDATGAQFNYSNFFVDDRGVMKLNGSIIDSTGLYTYPGDLNGFMVFTVDGSAQAYTFHGFSGAVSGTATSGFIIGGLNTLQVIMNNTGIGLDGSMHGNLAWNDGAALGLTGTISYVPEPSLVGFTASGLGLVWLLRQRRMRASE